MKAFRKIVADVALGKQSSRTLNTSDDIQAYFDQWESADRPSRSNGTFVPADIIQGRSVASAATAKRPEPVQKPVQTSPHVLPKNFKVRFGDDRLVDIRRELVRLKRDDFPNAGAVLLRVFLELSVVHYLRRTGELDKLIKRLEEKDVRLQFGMPTMKHLVPEIVRVAKTKLKSNDALRVEKALRYDSAAPFTITDLHAFVHSSELPSARDILQFWLRVEPLFRMMLEEDREGMV